MGCRTHLTWARWLLGYPDHALQIALEALRHAERLRHPFSCTVALHFLALVHEFRGDYRATVAIAEREMRLCDEHQFAFWGAISGMAMAGGLLGLGEAERASDLLREGLVAYAQIGALSGATYWRCQLAEACKAVGRFDEGLAVIAEAIRDADARQERWWEAELYRQQGELLCAAATRNGSSDDREAGIDSLTKALDIAKRQGAVSLELRAAMSLARRESNLPRVRTLYEQFTEGFETADLREAKALLGESPSRYRCLSRRVNDVAAHLEDVAEERFPVVRVEIILLRHAVARRRRPTRLSFLHGVFENRCGRFRPQRRVIHCEHYQRPSGPEGPSL